jgi:hypothetical protein
MSIDSYHLAVAGESKSIERIVDTGRVDGG